jgi:phage-related protein
MLSAPYHDGTTETGLIQDGVNVPASIRSWKLTQRLTSTLLQDLKEFFEGQGGGAIPFLWYCPWEAAGPIGSNYDSTGASTVGRHTVVFRGNWSETVSISLTDTSLEIAEIA